MIEAATQGLTTAIGWVGTTVTALTAETGELKELLIMVGISIGVSALMLGIKVVRSFTWGA